jgi:regulator of nucleoside diphosphate kinase
MPIDNCILTTKDFTILEVMQDRCRGDDPLSMILKRKIDTALVVFRDDVPGDVATLSSRVTFSMDGRDPDTRVLSPERMTSPVGMFLPITTLRGLSLLGLSEGQDFVLTDPEGLEERIILEKVQYQPEAARREKETAAGRTVPARRKPLLKLIRGAFHDRPRLEPAGFDGFDDPGPSAA